MAAQQLGAAARFGTSLAVKEVAICVVGAFYRAKFEFAYHGPLAIAAGVAPAAVEAIRLGRPPTLPKLPETQAVSYAVASELVRDHRISDATYARARAAFGEQGVIELVTVVGYYCLVALVLNAFEVPLDAGVPDPFPG